MHASPPPPVFVSRVLLSLVSKLDFDQDIRVRVLLQNSLWKLKAHFQLISSVHDLTIAQLISQIQIVQQVEGTLDLMMRINRLPL